MENKIFIDKIKQTLLHQLPTISGAHILVGLSGGADSVCLLHSLLALSSEFNLCISAAHVNHMLRGEEAERDERFVKNLCREWNVPCYCKKFDVARLAKENKQSTEEAGRNVRYAYFESLRRQYDINFIATAHHSDDNVETVIMRFLRGSGIHGLAGIPFCNDRNVIRPLLSVSRDEILEYLMHNNLQFVTDSTNTTTEYQRNKIRLELLPQLKAYNPNFKKTLDRNIRLYRDADSYLQEVGIQRFHALADINRYCVSFHLVDLQNEPMILQHLLISRAVQFLTNEFAPDAARIFEVEHCINSGCGTVSVGQGISAYILYGRLYLARDIAKDENSYFLPLNQSIRLSAVGISFSAIKTTERKSHPMKDIIYLSAEKVQNQPLSLRFRKDGDYFYPSEFGHRKSLQNYFVDKKIPRFMRNHIPLLMVGDEIAWVCGYRTDERFQSKTGDTDFIEITYTEEKEYAQGC